jgi:hypothetical protein
MAKHGQTAGSWTLAYDADFMRMEHYVKYPDMLPWVGKHYGKKYPKTIFVGESPYLPEGSKAQLKIDRWYNSTQKKLNKEELDYINLRVAPKGHIWSRPRTVMAELGMEPPPKSENIYEYFGYFNFFQRPAEKEGKGITPCARDCAVANAVFHENLAILMPRVVIFLSVKAWDNWDGQECSKIDSDYAPHPASKWWNMRTPNYAFRRSGPLTGSEKFRRLIKAYVLPQKT